VRAATARRGSGYWRCPCAAAPDGLPLARFVPSVILRAMKPRGQQKQIMKKKATHREAAITPARWFNLIIVVLLIGVIVIVGFGYLKQWL
jgi:hypothetical protein